MVHRRARLRAPLQGCLGRCPDLYRQRHNRNCAFPAAFQRKLELDISDADPNAPPRIPRRSQKLPRRSSGTKTPRHQFRIPGPRNLPLDLLLRSRRPPTRNHNLRTEMMAFTTFPLRIRPKSWTFTLLGPEFGSNSR